MSVDAVGGVWRYAMDLAAGLSRVGYRFTFVGFGPEPSPAQSSEAERIGQLLWRDAPLDWTTDDETQLDRIPQLLSEIVESAGIDLVHLNLPSQAAGLTLDVPVLVVSHSCVVTWFAGVRGTPVPPDWEWQFRRNRDGMTAADAVIAPSQSHAQMLRQSYGEIEGLEVVLNGSNLEVEPVAKEHVVFAAGRWWDDGKNGALLDAAAAETNWPVVMAGTQNGPNGQHLALHNVEALGHVPHDELARRVAQAAILASPSRYEPFGLAPLEAARAGAALVLADIATYRELWDGAALFAAPDDAAGFAAAINRLADDDDLRADYAQRAKARSARYSIDAQVTAMQDVYDGLLQPAHERGA
ncbi:glycosyltransferase family 4 protein [Devosia chinhatensis]|uniref:Glycosyltransferase family 4 protein n=2 Tax=Devosia aurantiaca TaxID=2714858 RepID=A0A6M1SW50_9HYPH|nr:glycosyltransferase family 4 protein [Devosia aurantiaca]